MNSIFRPVLGTGTALYCGALRRILSGLTDVAIATLDVCGDGVVVGTLPGAGLADSLPPRLQAHVPGGGKLTVFDSVQPDDELLARLDRYAGKGREVPGQTAADGRSWRVYRATFDTGVTDDIAVLLDDMASEAETRGFLATVWRAWRDDILDSALRREPEIGDKALLWMISSKIDIAVMVMNAKGEMLRANAAAGAALEAGDVLMRSPGGIRCVNDRQTRIFRDAIAACARSDPDTIESCLFLETSTPGHRVPVTLTRFQHEGELTDLVTVMLPLPPDSHRVEMLARRMGLTTAEARVAALMQMGLSNKAAAGLAGLREQSFSTYAKRVLSKLNVTSRAEMAQLLTWQAQGGRLS